MYKTALKSVVILATLVLLTFYKTSIVSADGASAGGCVSVYGGGVQCPRPGQVLLDKKVRNPATGIFVDNLGLSDPKYRPAWIVTFRIFVKNPGDETLTNVTVTDKLPSFVDYMSGPGSYDSVNRTVTFNVANLGGGATQTYDIKGRVVHSAVLPAEKQVVCPVNVADARVNSQADHDEAQFCIEKELVVPTVPKTGPEHWILSFGGLAATMIAGLYLKKKATISYR